MGRLASGSFAACCRLRRFWVASMVIRKFLDCAYLSVLTKKEIEELAPV